jgi:transmembrane sensor
MEEKFTNSYIEQLAHKYRQGLLSDEERKDFDLWYSGYNDTVFEHSGAANPDQVKQRIFNQIASQLDEFAVPAKRFRLWPLVAAAAAAVVVMVSGLYFFNDYGSTTKPDQVSAYLNDVAPGKVGATLTLANGRKISLTNARNGKLAEQAGISISKTADGQLVYEINGNTDPSDEINTLTTAKGETYILTLPDKSKVWMNAASSLTYTTSLIEHGQRRVKMSGEAYFEISKDKAHPFIVESGDQQVEVLGTHFNVNAYNDETVIRTTLLEGSVKLSEKGISKMLAPGKQAINQAGEIKIQDANTALVTAWKNNKFIFDRLNIHEIMRMVSRWYNVEVIYQGAAPEGTFWGSVSRFENVSEVLGPLEKTGNIHFKVEGRRIYVSR